MGKETFYFRHDYNARTDRKLVNIIMQHGMQGIGVYWCVVEMLYEEGGYLPLEYERISFELRISTDVIKSVINDFELFENDTCKFWSNAVLERLQERCDKSENARKSINKRWDKYRNTNVIRSNVVRNTKEERIVEKKEKKEKNKTLYGECVYLSKEEYQKIIEKHGQNLTDKAIELLNNYIQSSGKKYKSHYHTLLLWPIQRAQEGNNGTTRSVGRYERPGVRGQELSGEAQRALDDIKRIERERAASKLAAANQAGKDAEANSRL